MTYKSRGRPKPTDIGSVLGLQKQSALKWPLRSHTDSDLGDLYMDGKLRRYPFKWRWSPVQIHQE
jgi:hypothetical protein